MRMWKSHVSWGCRYPKGWYITGSPTVFQTKEELAVELVSRLSDEPFILADDTWIVDTPDVPETVDDSTWTVEGK